MRAELVLMGKRLDMAPQAHRKALVVMIYAGLAALMAAFWFLDRWHLTGVYMIFATIAVNRLLLGGYNSGGLIKPFSGKAPRQATQPPPYLMLALRVYVPEPDDSEFRNDERELQQRDRAHYRAYQWLAGSLAVLWMLADAKAYAPRLLAWLPVNADLLLYALVLAAVVVSQTLPQAMLLWNEPDMAELDSEL